MQAELVFKTSSGRRDLFKNWQPIHHLPASILSDLTETYMSLTNRTINN